MDEETINKIKTLHRIEAELRELLALYSSDSPDYIQYQNWLSSVRASQEALQR